MAKHTFTMNKLRLLKIIFLFVQPFIFLNASSSETLHQGTLDNITQCTQGAKTGYFQFANCKDRWWLVTPKGTPTILKGITGVKFSGPNTKEYRNAVIKKYGTEANWSIATLSRLRSWNFNTIGTWSSQQFRKTNSPYIVNLQIGFLSRIATPQDVKAGAIYKLPDVWSKKFAQVARQVSMKIVKPLATDPNLVGWETDNELSLRGYHQRGFHHYSALRAYLSLPTQAAGYKKAISFLTNRYKRENESLIKNWGVVGDKTVQRSQLTNINHRNNYRIESDEKAFLTEVAKQYANVISHAIRLYDNNHLILGIRHAGLIQLTNTDAINEMAEYFDAICVNIYKLAPPLVTLEYYSELAKKPIIVSEFSITAKRASSTEPLGSDNNQKLRAIKAAIFLRNLLASPSVVGYQWFNWIDGYENKNFGLVRKNDDTFVALTNALTEVNLNAEKIHAGCRIPLPEYLMVSRIDDEHEIAQSTSRNTTVGHNCEFSY